MKTLEELRAELAENNEKMIAMLDLVDASEEKRDMTEEETTDYEALEARDKELVKEILKKEEKLIRREQAEARKLELETPTREIHIHNVSGAAALEDPESFENFGEFVHSVRFNPRDARLEGLYDTREQSMGVGVEGGFLIPQQFRDELLSVEVQGAIVRPRATVIPAGSPPDASITIPVLNQGAAENMYGGVVVTWIAEGQAKPETDVTFRQVEWTPHEVAAHIVTTDKFLRNYSAASTFLSTQLRRAIAGEEDIRFLISGTGVGQPLSVIGSPVTITIARGTANTIVYQDLVNMEQEVRETGTSNYIYVAAPKIKSQLNTIVDPGTAGTLIWRRDAVGPNPNSLMGRPLVFNERSPGLGTAGDLMLVDLNEYYIKDGSGPFVAMSEHVYFNTNKTVIKAFWNVDGHPWLQEPIPLEGSTADTVSPFVVLGA